MPSRSKVAKLDPTIRTELDRLLKDGRYTIRDITGHLQQLGADISRGSVQRYGQKFERLAQRAREMREISGAFARELGEVPDSAATSMLAETLNNFLLRYAAEADDQDRQMDPKEIMMMARAVKDLASATRVSSELEMKIADRVAKEAAARVEKCGRKMGLTPDVLRRIQSEAFGIESPVSISGETESPPAPEQQGAGKLDRAAAAEALRLVGLR